MIDTSTPLGRLVAECMQTPNLRAVYVTPILARSENDLDVVAAILQADGAVFTFSRLNGGHKIRFENGSHLSAASCHGPALRGRSADLVLLVDLPSEDWPALHLDTHLMTAARGGRVMSV